SALVNIDDVEAAFVLILPGKFGCLLEGNFVQVYRSNTRTLHHQFVNECASDSASCACNDNDLILYLHGSSFLLRMWLRLYRNKSSVLPRSYVDSMGEVILPDRFHARRGNRARLQLPWGDP